MVKCLICSSEFETEKKLHLHLKTHNLRVFEYYQKTCPRHDLFDGSLILFKSKEYYFSHDFNSAANMCAWLLSKPEKERAIYLDNVLSRRKQEKEILYTPSQVELRSLKLPGIKYMNGVFIDYYEHCEKMGFINRHKFINKLPIAPLFDDKSATILIDTREQAPLEFSHATEVTGLKFGDYAFRDEEKYECCRIERKSLADFTGTLSNGFARFEREIIRAQEAGTYLVVLVEETLVNALRFNILSNTYRKNVRVTPEYVFHNVRALTQKYSHLQFLFVDGRQAAQQMIPKLFCLRTTVGQIDLQYYYDIGGL
jgi:hypothetical protein